MLCCAHARAYWRLQFELAMTMGKKGKSLNSQFNKVDDAVQFIDIN